MTRIHEEASEKTYRAIGRFMFEFSQAEYAIRHYLAEEIGLDDDFFDAIISSYDVAMLCRATEEVFKKSRTETNSAAILELLHAFLDLNTYRNRVAHGLWVPFMKGGTVHSVARSSLKSRSHDGQAVFLEELADKANTLRAKLEHEFMCPSTNDTSL